jgi:glycosyltransferase involved in cell wall biosynthesis
MKIAILGLHFAEYSSRLAVALGARHEVLLILSASNAGDELTEELRQQVEHVAQVRYLSLRRRRDPRLLATSLSTNRMIRRFRPDVVHIQEVNPVLTAGSLLCLPGSYPVVLTVHDPVGHSGTSRPDSWEFRLFLRLRCKATRMIVHGPRMRDELLGLDQRLAGRVDVIAHGILGRDDVVAECAGSDPATFLFFGRIESYKGLGVLLDAADMLRSRGAPVHLVIAGTGADLAAHRTRIMASEGIELIDRYVAARDVPALFRRCTAAVLPYTDATQSGVATIALANGRPVIASNVGDLPDIVLHGRTGLLVPPRDPAALADAMARLAAEASLLDALATGAAGFARERLAWPRIAEQVMGSYQRAIASRRTLSSPCVAQERPSPPG